MTPMRVVSNYLETQTGAPRSYSFFNASAGFVFAAHDQAHRFDGGVEFVATEEFKVTFHNLSVLSVETCHGASLQFRKEYAKRMPKL